MWRSLRDTLKTVVSKHKSAESAKAINDELSKITYDCICNNDTERINHMVATLEEEWVGAKTALQWFVEVLQSESMKSCFATMNVNDRKRVQLVDDITKKISEIDFGPVSRR